MASAGPYANHMHSLQTDNHSSTSPLSFYRPDALPAAKQTALKHLKIIILFTKCGRIVVYLWNFGTVILMSLQSSPPTNQLSRWTSSELSATLQYCSVLTYFAQTYMYIQWQMMDTAIAVNCKWWVYSLLPGFFSVLQKIAIFHIHNTVDLLLITLNS